MAASCLSPVGDTTRTCSLQTSTKTIWWPQRDSNPCFSLERAVSWASRRWGRPNATSDRTLHEILLAGGGGFEPPLRGPEPRVLPLDDPPPTHPTLPYLPTNDRPARRNAGGTPPYRTQRIADLSVRLGRKRGTLAVGI